MNKEKIIVSKLERRQGMGRIRPDNIQSNTWDSDEDLGEYVNSLTDKKKFVIFREEKLPGKSEAKVSSFTRSPFDNLEDALGNAKKYISTILARLQELDKTKTYTFLEKAKDSRFEGGISYLIVGNAENAKNPSAISKNSYTLQVYVRLTEYYQKETDREKPETGKFVIKQLRFTNTGKIYDDFQREANTLREAEKLVNKLFDDAKSNYRLDLGDYTYIEEKLAKNPKYDKLVKVIFDNKIDKIVTIVAPVGLKTTNLVPDIPELKNK